jgi:hypothetical protein
MKKNILLSFRKSVDVYGEFNFFLFINLFFF